MMLSHPLRDARATAAVALLLLLPVACDQDAQDEDGHDEDPTGIDAALEPGDLVLPVADEPDPPELPDGIRLRVMTFNLHGGGDAAAAEIGAYLATRDVDLVGLQECPADLVEPLARAGGFEHFDGAGVAMLSRTPLVDVTLGALQAGRSYVHATTTIESVPVSVYVAHLSWNLDGDRQCRQFVDEVLAADPLPHLVLLGDFNDEHYSTQNAILEEVLVDAFTALGWYPGERISWPATGFDGTEGSQLIDLIFFRRAFPAIVVSGEVDNLTPVLSDHKPALAELLYPRDPSTPFATDPLAARRDPWRRLPPAGSRPDNLLSNPDAEDGLAGWDATGGARAVAAQENQVPRTGGQMFAGFDVASADAVVLSTGSQVVDLTDSAERIAEQRGRLYVSGYLTTGFQAEAEEPFFSNKPRPYDEGEIVVEALDAAGALLARRTSRRRDTLAWHPYVDALDLPPATRRARLTWASHHKAANGASNDALFDDLYLGLGILEAPHRRLGGNLLSNPGVETGTAAGWTADRWQVQRDQQYFGLFFPAPGSLSGEYYLFAGEQAELEPGATAVLAQRATLEDPALLAAQQAGRLALRWGGWVRSFAAHATITVALEIYDERDDSLWGTLTAAPVSAAEWTRVEQLTRIPAGASAVRLTVSTALEALGTGAFVDELFVLPEEVPAD